MIELAWKNCTITIATSATQSAEVAFDRAVERLSVYVPTIDSATLTLYAAETTGGTFYPVGNSQTIAAGTGGFFDSWKANGLQFFKIYSSADQTENRTFRVRGVRG